MKIIIEIPDNNLEEIIRKVLREELNVPTPPTRLPSGTRQEVADYLQISVSKLDMMTRSGELKAFKLGGRQVRYKWKDIDEYLDNKVNTSHR